MAANANPTEAIEAIVGLPGHRSRLKPKPGIFAVVVVSQKKLNDFSCSTNNASFAGCNASSELVNSELGKLLEFGVQLTTSVVIKITA